MTINYRQTNPELKVILDYYRKYSYMEGEILERKEFRIITQDELIHEFSEGDHILTSIHAHRNVINNNIYETNSMNMVPVMIHKSSDKKQRTLPYYTKNYKRKVVNELNTLPVKQHTEEPIMKDINGFKVTESKDKIKIFTKNLNIKKLVELIRNLFKDKTFFVQVNYEGNYSPMKKVNSTVKYSKIY